MDWCATKTNVVLADRLVHVVPHWIAFCVAQLAFPDPEDEQMAFLSACVVCCVHAMSMVVMWIDAMSGGPEEALQAAL